MALTQTRLAKFSDFAEEKTNLSPSVRMCMALKYGSKLVLFYTDESTHLREFLIQVIRIHI